VNALQGQLSEGVLANLLQYFQLNQSSGCLTLRHLHGLQGLVYFEEGRVTHIDSPPLMDIPALSVLLTWEEGRFSFRSGVATPNHTLKLSTESLLLEASYRADIVKSSEGGLITPDSVWQGAPLGGDQSTVAVSLRAIHLLQHIDGERSLDELSLRTGLAIDSVMEATRELYRHGLIARVQVPMLDRGFLAALTRATVDIMGPMGEIVVEDALFDLGLRREAVPEHALTDLLAELSTQFRDQRWRQRFLEKVEMLRHRFGLAA
jgi:DNA-binding transcriptional ArsR family regulator